MSRSIRVPVAFMVYNRPAQTRRVFDVIKRAKPATLYLIADGPRNDRDAQACEGVREIVSAIDWGCDVHRNFADTNLGLRSRPSTGLDWVFANESKAIVLEDDCLPDISFFNFCSDLLDRYEDDERVMQIGGTNFQPGQRDRESYHFSRYSHIWGWATWRRAWAKYDVNMARWPELRDAHAFDHLWPSGAERRFWTRALNAVYDGRITTWDYQWTFAMWCNGGLSIVPPVNLVSNIGFGVDATNTRHVHALAALPTEPVGPLRHPATISCDDNADRIQWRTVFYEPPVRRAVRWLRRALERISPYHST